MGLVQHQAEKAMPEVANLADPATRRHLTPAAIEGMVRLAAIWRLSGTEASALLGDMSERTWFRLKGGDRTGALAQDVLTRVSALVGIYKGLHLLFSDPLADDWVRLENRGMPFHGRRPLDLMIEGGIPSMLDVRRHVDALRGGL